MSNENLTNQEEQTDPKSTSEESKKTFFGSLRHFIPSHTPPSDDQEETDTPEEDMTDLRFCLSAPVQLMESTHTSRDDEEIVQSEPINHFYFCSSDCLTIGYGTKIECSPTGKLYKEGLETIKKLKFYKNGKELSLDQKIQLVKDCCSRRNAYDRSHAKKLSQTSLEAQKNILFNYGISKQNAIETALYEYQKKQEKLLRKNPNFNKNYILLALGTDIAYQYGDKGITDTNLYKSVKKNKIPTNANFGKYGDRTILREWLLKTALLFDEDAKKRGNQLATPESQEKIFMTSLKSFADMFHKHIMCREDHKTLLMEKSMTLVMIQNFKNIYGKVPNTQEIKNIQEKAKEVVYNTLFQSKALEEIPKRYHPYAVLQTIANASMGNNPIAALQKAAEKTVEQTNKKLAKKKTNLNVILKGAEENKKTSFNTILNEAAEKTPFQVNEENETPFPFNNNYNNIRTIG